MAGLPGARIANMPSIQIPLEELKAYQEIIQRYNMEEDLPHDLVTKQNELISNLQTVPDISNINTVNTINQII